MKYNFIVNDPEERAKVTRTHILCRGLFAAAECDRIVRFCEAKSLHDAGASGAGGNVTEDDAKKQGAEISDIKFDADSAWFFERINGTFYNVNNGSYGFDLNGYSFVRFAHYQAGQGYDWHTDLIFNEDAHASAHVRKLSISILLNDDFSGGELQLNRANPGGPIDIGLQKGDAVLFASFMTHQLCPVTKGSRKSLQAFCLGPKFQ